MRLIDADALWENVESAGWWDNADRDIVEDLIIDALTIRQEFVAPLFAEHSFFGTNRVCSKCKKYLFPGGCYCPHCGAEVIWNEIN